MRISALAIAGVLAVAISIPAVAATKKKAASSSASVNSFEACESKATALGMPHGQAGHNEYVRECMGKRPSNSHTPGQ